MEALLRAWSNAAPENNMLSASKVAGIFNKSGLSSEILRRIWNESKQPSTPKGYLTLPEYKTACSKILNIRNNKQTATAPKQQEVKSAPEPEPKQATNPFLEMTGSGDGADMSTATPVASPTATVNNPFLSSQSPQQQQPPSQANSLMDQFLVLDAEAMSDGELEDLEEDMEALGNVDFMDTGEGHIDSDFSDYDPRTIDDQDAANFNIPQQATTPQAPLADQTRDPEPQLPPLPQAPRVPSSPRPKLKGVTPSPPKQTKEPLSLTEIVQMQSKTNKDSQTRSPEISRSPERKRPSQIEIDAQTRSKIGLTSKDPGPFLSDALVTGTESFLFKTARAQQLLVGDEFWVKKKNGTTILEVPGKIDFAKRKEMTIQFTPKMAGVFFTPGAFGRPEGDQKVAFIQRKKRYFEIQGYKPYFDGQTPSNKKDMRYLWGRVQADFNNSFTVGVICQGGGGGKKSEVFEEKYAIKKALDRDAWNGFYIDEENEEQIFTISKVNFNMGGLQVETTKLKPSANHDQGMMLCAALLVEELHLIL